MIYDEIKAIFLIEPFLKFTEFYRNFEKFNENRKKYVLASSKVVFHFKLFKNNLKASLESESNYS